MRRREFLQRISIAAGVGQETSYPGALGCSVDREAPNDQNAKKEQRDFFYRPKGAWVGDLYPFYADGMVWVFFQPAWHDPAHLTGGIPWYLSTTEDMVHFKEYGQVLAPGRSDEQDFDCYTGSVIEADGLYHMFYCGTNDSFRQQGKPVESVMHAVSRDLRHWTKIPEDRFYAPTHRFESNDWRDPFVLWNEEAKEYWMLVVARLNDGPPRRRGCIALCVSKDLRKWKVREPLSAPGRYVAQECPDLFRMGEWWYLLFSEFREEHRIHYRLSRSLHGPWLTPENDSLDGRAFYAARTVSIGQRRLAFGWNPTRYDKIDYLRWNQDFNPAACKSPPKRMIGPSGWDWGGNLVVHELSQEPDGTLSVQAPESVASAFSQLREPHFQRGFGAAQISEQDVQISALGVFACSPAGEMPRCCKIEARIAFEKGTSGCGLMLRVSDDLDSAYYIRLEPISNRLVFDTWPRPGDLSFDVGVERPIALFPGNAVDLTIFIDDTVCVVYAGRRVALNARLYDLKQGHWGVFVSNGSARFTNLRTWVP